MTELTTWLLEQIAAEEAVARAALRRVARWTEAAPPWESAKVMAHLGPLEAFAALHDPARVLARCAADRRIVELCGRDHTNEEAEWVAGYTLHALALPYADHPDYREEWGL